VRFFDYTAAAFARLAGSCPQLLAIHHLQVLFLKRLIPLLFLLLIAIWIIVAVVVISRVPAA
jgi:hypothetical protein